MSPRDWQSETVRVNFGVNEELREVKLKLRLYEELAGTPGGAEPLQVPGIIDGAWLATQDGMPPTPNTSAAHGTTTLSGETGSASDASVSGRQPSSEDRTQTVTADPMQRCNHVIPAHVPTNVEPISNTSEAAPAAGPAASAAPDIAGVPINPTRRLCSIVESVADGLHVEYFLLGTLIGRDPVHGQLEPRVVRTVTLPSGTNVHMVCHSGAGPLLEGKPGAAYFVLDARQELRRDSRRVPPFAATLHIAIEFSALAVNRQRQLDGSLPGAELAALADHFPLQYIQLHNAVYLPPEPGGPWPRVHPRLASPLFALPPGDAFALASHDMLTPLIRTPNTVLCSTHAPRVLRPRPPSRVLRPRPPPRVLRQGDDDDALPHTPPAQAAPCSLERLLSG